MMQVSRSPSMPLRMALCMAMAILVATPGCVRRRLTVRTNPPGALVYVDNRQIGTTPCSVDFTYYGTREIRMVKAGYETLTVNQPLPTPWYETPGVDFVSENLVPWRIRDDRVVNFNLAPQRLVPAEELIGRGEQLRRQASQPVVPVGAMAPTGSPPLADPFGGAPVFSSSPTPPALTPATPPPPAFRY